MRVSIATVLVVAAAGVFAGCGSEAADAPVPRPSSGKAYRALDESERLAVAAGCRDRAAARADGVAADELRRVDARALRGQLDTAFRLIRQQRRQVAEVCAERLPFVIPGLSLSFEGAERHGDEFTYETTSEKPLTIRGAVSPAPRRGTVAVRRAYERSTTHTTPIGADGSFTLPAMRLRKIANNTFIVAIHTPPSALRQVYFSAICLDCLAGGPRKVMRVAPSPASFPVYLPGGRVVRVRGVGGDLGPRAGDRALALRVDGHGSQLRQR